MKYVLKAFPMTVVSAAPRTPREISIFPGDFPGPVVHRRDAGVVDRGRAAETGAAAKQSK